MRPVVHHVLERKSVEINYKELIIETSREIIGILEEKVPN